MTSTPPGNDFCRLVFAASRDLGSATLRLRQRVSRIIGAILISEYRLTSSIVGCISSIGPGSWSMQYPTMLFIVSDFPTCEAATTTICSISGSVKLSRISNIYGVRDVRHLPTSADDSDVSRRFLSAHCDTVRSSGGFMPLRIFARQVFSLFTRSFSDSRNTPPPPAAQTPF